MLTVVQLGNKDMVIVIKFKPKNLIDLGGIGGTVNPTNRLQSKVAYVLISIQMLKEGLASLGMIKCN